MAVEVTPLGFQKPDGNEPVRGGDNVIAANAQKAEDQIQTVRGRLDLIESTGAAADGIVVDPADPDTLLVSTGAKVTTDPADADALIFTT